jgi:hypothetical protein
LSFDLEFSDAESYLPFYNESSSGESCQLGSAAGEATHPEGTPGSQGGGRFAPWGLPKTNFTNIVSGLARLDSRGRLSPRGSVLI